MTKPDVREAIEVLDLAMKASGQAREMLAKPEVIAALQVVGCEINARPKDAPTFDDIKPHILAVHREPARLRVEFVALAAAQVAAFVAAEQQCCSDLRFSVIAGDPTVMQIDATSELVDAVAGWMTRSA